MTGGITNNLPLIDFDSVDHFLAKARKAHESGDAPTFFAARALIVVALGSELPRANTMQNDTPL